MKRSIDDAAQVGQAHEAGTGASGDVLWQRWTVAILRGGYHGRERSGVCRRKEMAPIQSSPNARELVAQDRSLRARASKLYPVALAVIVLVTHVFEQNPIRAASDEVGGGEYFVGLEDLGELLKRGREDGAPPRHHCRIVIGRTALALGLGRQLCHTRGAE